MKETAEPPTKTALLDSEASKISWCDFPDPEQRALQERGAPCAGQLGQGALHHRLLLQPSRQPPRCAGERARRPGVAGAVPGGRHLQRLPQVHTHQGPQRQDAGAVHQQRHAARACSLIHHTIPSQSAWINVSAWTAFESVIGCQWLRDTVWASCM
uniref:Uncharacterized protein n=1 Tax=Aegilops tauschii subsp. strangulata TaxID=200361 RepID=A0A453KEP8_AEGTS